MSKDNLKDIRINLIILGVAVLLRELTLMFASKHANLHVCVLHQAVLKVRAKPWGDVLARVHLTAVLLSPLSFTIGLTRSVTTLALRLL